MDSRKYQFVSGVLGEDGAKALVKAAERASQLETALVPRTILAWLGSEGQYDYVGNLPGVDNTFISFEKSEAGYTGSIGINHDIYTFRNAPVEHVAASVAVALGIDSDPSVEATPIQLSRLGKSIDVLAKTEFAKKLAKNIVPAQAADPAALPGHVHSYSKAPPASQLINQLAAGYMQSVGKPYTPLNAPPAVDENYSRALAGAYHSAQHNPNDPAVASAYNALKSETLAQYNYLKANGFRFSPYDETAGGMHSTPDGVVSPYPTTDDLFNDISANKHLHVFTGGSPPPDHPLSERLPVADPLGTYNNAFRAVHDIFGHAKSGADFGHHGEEHTYHTHGTMYGPEAKKALLTETRGQNAWFHFGPHGEANRANPATGTFPDQKAAIMPPEFHQSKVTSPPIAKAEPSATGNASGAPGPQHAPTPQAEPNKPNAPQKAAAIPHPPAPKPPAIKPNPVPPIRHIPGFKTRPNFRITKSQSESKCAVCGEKQFNGNKFVGCTCFRGLAKSVEVATTPDGFMVQFQAGWDNDAITTLLESLGVKR